MTNYVVFWGTFALGLLMVIAGSGWVRGLGIAILIVCAVVGFIIHEALKI